MLIEILFACTAIMLLSLSGIALIYKKQSNLMIYALIALASGAFIGNALLHLAPEAIEMFESGHDTDHEEHGLSTPFLVMIIGFTTFMFIEKGLQWRHCHDPSHRHSFGYMNVLGDCVHNFLDGIVIASAFMVNTGLGVSTAIAIAFHEVPQELADFAILLKSKFAAKEALIMNVAVASSVIAGGLAGYMFNSIFIGLLPYILAFAAGSFLYMSATDLIPQLTMTKDSKQNLLYLAMFLVGVLIFVVMPH